MAAYLMLLGGLVCAGLGGELFVRAAVGLARWARVSAGIIGATVAAFATSAPELTVAISAGLEGRPRLSFGDALGSNIVNVGLVLGLVLTIAPMSVGVRTVRRDFTVALLAPPLVLLLAMDGFLSRLDGIIVLLAFFGWLLATVLEARRQRSAAAAVLGEAHRWHAIMMLAGGLLLLIAAGRLIVLGGVGLAAEWNIDPFVVGAVLIAIGTSVPELATAAIASWRGHDEVGFGTILGSNIFNGLFIVGVVTLLSPFAVDRTQTAMALGFGVLIVAAAWVAPKGGLTRRRGALLLILYAAYLGGLLQLGADAPL
jgi:cation:H+ antiporter